MTVTFKFKRGTGSDPSASDMVVGEPVLRTDTAELFFKKDDNSVAKVSGGGGGPDFKYLALRNAANNGAASYPGNDFTLVTSGTTTAISPAAANTLLVSYGGVIQKPNSGTSTSGITGFIVDGSRIKTATNFAAAPDFILYQEAGGIGEPSDNTVSEAKLNVSNSPTNGYFLSAQSGNTGGLTWATVPAGVGGATGVDFNDSVKARWGTGNDLELYHSGSASYIQNSTGFLFIHGNDIALRSTAGENYIVCDANAEVELFYDNSKKLSTVASGIKVERTDATQSYITMSTSDGDAGFLFGNSNTEMQLMDGQGHPFFKGIKDGAVSLYHDNTVRLATNADGIEVNGHVWLGDGEHVKFGAGTNGDLQIYHNGTYSQIKNTTGGLYLENTGEIGLISGTYASGEWMVRAIMDGAVQLFHDGTKKAETNSSGLLVNDRLQVAGPSIYDKAGTGNSIGIQLSSSGVLPTDGSGTAVNNSKNLGSSSYKWAQVYATTFYGDGSNLTNLPASGIPASGGTFTGDIAVSGGAGALTVSGNSDIRLTNGNWTGDATKLQHHSDWLYMQGGSNGIIFRHTNGYNRWLIDSSGNFYPAYNDTHDIGTSSYRVRNLYVNDMHFSNEGKTNSVDGTWGDWTLQEGEENIFMINNRSGKRYKMALQEVT